MQIGDKVTSKLYAEKGTGTILGFTELFGESFVELLFENGEKSSTSINDISIVDTLLSKLQDANLEDPHAFLAKNMALRLKVNLSANKIVTSANYKIQPLPHQLLAVHFVMDRFQPRSLIVDECIKLTETITSSFADAKFRKLIEVIDEIKNREGQIDLKFIIFTEFRATQSAIIEFLQKFGYTCSHINGSLSREERVGQVELFRNANQIMISTDAGGEGINLTNGDTGQIVAPHAGAWIETRIIR